jgi:teichuronic acid exporter
VGTVTMRIIKLLMIIKSRRALFSLPKFSIRITFKIIRENAGLIGHRMFYIFYEYVPTILSGRILGPKQTGFYFTSYDLAGIPGSRMMNIINQVALPVYSRLQGDSARFENALLRGTALICLVYLPCIVGLAAVAEPFVKIVLGAQWIEATEVFQIMCIAWAMKSVWDFFENPLLAAHQEKLLWRMQIFRIVCLIFCCILFQAYGARGFAMAFLIVSLMSSVMAVFLGGKSLNIGRAKIAKIIFNGSLCAALMFLSVISVLHFLSQYPSIFKLIAGIGVGIISFSLSAYILQKSAFIDLVALIKHGLFRSKK